VQHPDANPNNRKIIPTFAKKTAASRRTSGKETPFSVWDCKGKNLFHSRKIYLKIFPGNRNLKPNTTKQTQKIPKQTGTTDQGTTASSEAGCKGKVYSVICNIFRWLLVMDVRD